ncbi:MAG: hypothetical protein ACFFC7_11255 [Candidatus Hermodarchaeota archaeon]
MHPHVIALDRRQTLGRSLLARIDSPQDVSPTTIARQGMLGGTVMSCMLLRVFFIRELTNQLQRTVTLLYGSTIGLHF